MLPGRPTTCKTIREKAAFAPALNWENVKLPSWKQPDILPWLLSHLKAFPLPKACLPVSPSPFSHPPPQSFPHCLAPPLGDHSLLLHVKAALLYTWEAEIANRRKVPVFFTLSPWCFVWILGSFLFRVCKCYRYFPFFGIFCWKPFGTNWHRLRAYNFR